MRTTSFDSPVHSLSYNACGMQESLAGQVRILQLSGFPEKKVKSKSTIYFHVIYLE